MTWACFASSRGPTWPPAALYLNVNNRSNVGGAPKVRQTSRARERYALRLARDGNGGLKLGAGAGRAVDLEPSTERLDPVLEPDQPGAAFRVRAAGPVVLDRDPQGPAEFLHAHVDYGGARVLGGVGDRLRHDVV